MELSGGEIIIEALKEEGVSHIFGYPGGAVLHIYDALYKQEDVQHILVRHEQGATHAADAYARATGKPCSIARIRAWLKCCCGPAKSPNHASFVTCSNRFDRAGAAPTSWAKTAS